MKRNRIEILFSLVFVSCSIFLFSCKKELVDTAQQVGSSKVTYYATVTLNGDQYLSVDSAGTYTDQGAVATVEGKNLDVKVSGSVNTSVVGLYTLTYSAVNSDGFSASATRTVAVLPSPEVTGVDVSGSYFYVATGANNSVITKLAPGFYSTSNCWSSATTISCLFICVDGTKIRVPSQSTPFGQLSGSGTLSPTGALTYIISIPSQGINNSARKWQKAQ